MEDFKIINLDEKIKYDEWKLPMLYKIRGDSKIHCWEIGFNGKYIIIIHGITDGKKIIDKIKPELILTDKDIKSRGYTEIKTRYNNKIKKGYTSGDVNSLRQPVTPMLANLYEENMNITFPIYCQVKLDGIRCLITLFNSKVEMCSRSNTSYNYIKHIRKEIIDFLLYFPQETYFDGELYIHDTKLQNIASIVNTGKNGGKLHENYKDLRYCIFDIDLGNDMPFDLRYNLLIKMYKKYLNDGNKNNYFCIVSCNIIHSKEEIPLYFKKAIKMGYEGLMLKKIAYGNSSKKSIISSRYVHYRSNNILKYKNKKDEEGEILKVLECKGREEGNAKFLVRNDDGYEFILKINGTFEFRQKLLDDKDELIGKKITYTYSSKSSNGVPMHCYATSIRDYE